MRDAFVRASNSIFSSYINIPIKQNSKHREVRRYSTHYVYKTGGAAGCKAPVTASDLFNAKRTYPTALGEIYQIDMLLHLPELKTSTIIWQRFQIFVSRNADQVRSGKETIIQTEKGKPTEAVQSAVLTYIIRNPLLFAIVVAIFANVNEHSYGIFLHTLSSSNIDVLMEGLPFSADSICIRETYDQHVSKEF